MSSVPWVASVSLGKEFLPKDGTERAKVLASQEENKGRKESFSLYSLLVNSQKERN